EWQTTSPEGLRLRARLDQRVGETAVTTIVTYEEQCQGWLARIAKSKTLPKLVQSYHWLARHIDVYQRLSVLEFDQRAASKFEELVKARLGIGTHDLRIAAIALVHNATLLSRNLKDFTKVPGLRVEDWTI
ncbi:MAG TPA: type II toxin-antitoxin system VapC family toxin, partial [Planctomycetaceae bacterium]|nr:type II toxin-antitoxin system VapC family toxin [Planctomycetaceae bacterium]